MIISVNSSVILQVQPDADVMPRSSAPLACSLVLSAGKACDAEDQVKAQYNAMHKAQLEYLFQ